MSCEKCNGLGYIETEIDGYVYSKECECLIEERNREKIKRYIENSGLDTAFDNMTFDTFKEDSTASKALKEKARQYLNDHGNYWWYIAGKSGCGKTHITTAICGELIKKAIPVYYMQWRDESTELKALINNDVKYGEKMRRLKKVKVLYIDDFFKGAVTDADVKLAFEIINARYINRLTTLFSSELSVNDIVNIDEAVGGRINEMAGKYALNVRKIGNRRLKNG